MNAIILLLVFAASAIVAIGITLAFAPAIEAVLAPLLSPIMSKAWAQYVKFALFTASLAGGLRPLELGGLASRKAGAIDGGEGTVEVFKTVLGGLETASTTLLIFFGTALIVYAGLRAYESLSSRARRSHEFRPHDARPGHD